MILYDQQKMMKWLTLLIAVVTFSCTTYAFENLNMNTNFSSDTAFIGANVLNPTVDIPITNATILVSNGNIVKIQPGNLSIPPNYAIVDIQGKWVIPGLIDGHIHLAQSGGAFTRPDTFDATKIMSYEEDQQWLLDNSGVLLKNYLKLGITSVFDMGGPSEYLGKYRNVMLEGIYPDVYAAGTLLAPFDVPILNNNGKTFTKITTIEEAKELVRKQLTHNTDMIKIVWSQETGLSNKELFSLYQPAIELAKKHNKVIAVHVESLIDAKMAIKVGADILVHGVMSDLIDDEFINLMKKSNVTYMPTLSSYSHYFDLFKNELTFSEFEYDNSSPVIINSFKKLMDNSAKTGKMFQMLLQYVPKVDEKDEVIAKLSEQGKSIVGQLKTMFSTKFEEIQQINLKKVVDANVNVAFGTDAGNPGTLHASSMMGELYAWQKAGVSNQKILKAMTFGNASALNLDENIGSILAGRYANFVVLTHNPYQDLATLTKPEMTVKRGVVVNFNKGSHHDK
jgi:imidazolonepropionase-like amidohydrolase